MLCVLLTSADSDNVTTKVNKLVSLTIPIPAFNHVKQVSSYFGIDHVKSKMKIINNLLDRNISRKASGSSSSSSSSEEDQDVQNGHGFHEGCCCEKCLQRFLEIHIICLYINI